MSGFTFNDLEHGRSASTSSSATDDSIGDTILVGLETVKSNKTQNEVIKDKLIVVSTWLNNILGSDKLINTLIGDVDDAMQQNDPLLLSDAIDKFVNGFITAVEATKDLTKEEKEKIIKSMQPASNEPYSMSRTILAGISVGGAIGASTARLIEGAARMTRGVGDREGNISKKQLNSHKLSGHKNVVILFVLDYFRMIYIVMLPLK